MDCNTAAASLCGALGEFWGPFVALAVANVLTLVGVWLKSHKTAKVVLSNTQATEALKAEVAETKALVSIRPPAINISGTPSIPPTEGGEL